MRILPLDQPFELVKALLSIVDFVYGTLSYRFRQTEGELLCVY